MSATRSASGVKPDTPLICIRVSDHAPPVKSYRGVYCGICSEEVWVAFSSPEGMTRLWCWDCAADQIAKAEARGEKTSFGVTTRQLADLARRYR